ncbi:MULTISPECIES: chemotaxis protein CheX [Cellulomonas]|uniref:chemotaxis protein CheX n=1 Tax=Cellulomonas TaxID=1707 RepID=UPI0010A81805|nr:MULTISPECIES: chemotaxis protein CheX [Cellulomonas]
MSQVIAGEDVYAIAQDIFASMVDGDVGTIVPWEGPPPGWQEPVTAWVDLQGDWAGRASLTTETSTAHALARALLGFGEDEPVERADLVDAFGEVVNVVGGNVKSLLETTGSLGLPQVADVDPGLPGGLVLSEMVLAWHGRALELVVRAVL